MSQFDKPWMIGGGVEHEVEVARALAYASTGGAEGPVTGGDLKVEPLPVPGTKIRVLTGGAVILNKFPGGQGQSYIARLPVQEEVQVTATGSGGARTDLVVARIYDFQYAGQTPPDVQDFDYAQIAIIENVPAGTRTTRELNLNYPAIALARLDLPRNTGTVTAAHITDMRSVAQPRTDRTLFVTPMNLSDGEHMLNSTTSTGMRWPYAGKTNWWVDIPVWAQRARVLGSWHGVYLETHSKRSSGKIWVRMTTENRSWTRTTQDIAWQIDTLGGAGGTREAWIAGDDMFIPNEMRGLRVELNLMGNMVKFLPENHRPVLNQFSSVSLDIEFYETGAGGPRS